MAATQRRARQRGHLQGVAIAASLALALIAVSPIVFALLGGLGGAVGPRTAFATAPGGDYAVVSRTEDDVDIIAVAPASDPSAAVEVARVAHVPGYSSTGAVSPDGRRVALITVDGGTQSRPLASLLVVDLETAVVTRLALDVMPMQTPAWYPDGESIVVSRAERGGESGGPVQLLRVAANGDGEELVQRHASVLGAYPIGFDAQGRFVAVLIDERGSTVQRDGASPVPLSPHITRDWRLSPDGSQVAFIEANTDGGLRYLARSVSLDENGAVQAQSLTAAETALGVAWKPGQATPTFGKEPAAVVAMAESGNATTQSLSVAAGFDVPLAYSSDGAALVVNHWTGASFDEPGQASLQMVTEAGRSDVAGYTRFLGWARR